MLDSFEDYFKAFIFSQFFAIIGYGVGVKLASVVPYLKTSSFFLRLLNSIIINGKTSQLTLSGLVKLSLYTLEMLVGTMSIEKSINTLFDALTNTIISDSEKSVKKVGKKR